MPAESRPNPRTRETVHRVYRFPKSASKRITKKRKEFGVTVAEFLSQAVTHELPKLEREIRKLDLPGSQDQTYRPARLPMTDKLLAALKDASESTGIPASRLLLTCLNRATRRQRKWPK